MIAALLLAAGRGRRLGHVRPKQFLPLGGHEIIVYSLYAFQKSELVGQVGVVVDGQWEGHVKEIVERYHFGKVSFIIEGGASRQESSRIGVEALGEDVELVLIHDGVRPFVSEGLIERVVAGVEETGACVPALPVYDTIKVAEGGFVKETLDRESLFAVQTPQGFRRELILEAHRVAQEENFLGSDDAVLVERLGKPVKIVEGDPLNIKITTAEDLILAERILHERGMLWNLG